MRIFAAAAILALAFAQGTEETAETTETTETTEEETPEEPTVDYEGPWDVEVTWTGVETSDESKTNQFKTGKVAPAVTGLPTALVLSVDEEGAYSMKMSMETGWTLEWENRNTANSRDIYTAIGWAW